VQRHHRYAYAAILRLQFAAVFSIRINRIGVKRRRKGFVTDTGYVLAYTNMLLAPVFDPAAGKVHVRVCHDNPKDQWWAMPRIMTAH
jgi:hypothetical protein